MLLYYPGHTLLRSRVAQSIKLLREANRGQACSRTSFFKPVMFGLVTGHNVLFAEVLAKAFTKIKKLSPFVLGKIFTFDILTFFFKIKTKYTPQQTNFLFSENPMWSLESCSPYCHTVTSLHVFLSSLPFHSVLFFLVFEYLEWCWPLYGHVWECLSFLSSSF